MAFVAEDIEQRLKMFTSESTISYKNANLKMLTQRVAKDRKNIYVEFNAGDVM